MSLLEENSFFDDGASVNDDCEAGSGPTTHPLRAPRSRRENSVLRSCPGRAGAFATLAIFA